MLTRIICVIAVSFCWLPGNSQTMYSEKYRPQIHFSPKSGWMNDPNGLLFYHGTYHLFFQYYPDSTVWGPMHWGHAVSHDLFHWTEEKIALYPDSIGYIFSGSAVADSMNTSGFGTPGQTPLVAIFTQHNPSGEKAGTNTFQNQSLAYSLDEGNTWIKYAGNPVLKTPGLKDFRDPKVAWHADSKKWIMTLAAGDRIMFYSSADLKTWVKESEFGKGIGAHGGVWECPDLVSFSCEGKTIWLLIVNINPGGVQGGSGTQYFTGDFDGKTFSAFDTVTRWADYGPDDYAGITYSNTGKNRIFLGWMSNWLYATKVPTEKWRSAMTIPRVLGLKKLGQTFYTTMTPVNLKARQIPVTGRPDFKCNNPCRIDMSISDLKALTIGIRNHNGQEVRVGFDKIKNSFFIDRTRAGRSDFDSSFAAVHYAPRITRSKGTRISIILDHSSLEFFADDGLTTMTEIFFPDSPLDTWKVYGKGKLFDRYSISEFAPAWRNK